MKTAKKSPGWTFFTTSSSDEVKTSENLKIYILLENLQVNESFIYYYQIIIKLFIYHNRKIISTIQ